MSHRQLQILATLAFTMLAAGSTFAQSNDDKRRAELLANTQETPEKLLAQVEGANALYDKAAGYAVFTATKAGFVVTGGAGSGVCIDKVTADTVYMRMGTGGAGLGFGAQRYDLVILFESAERLKTFVDGGWDGGVAAQATAGSGSAAAGSGFLDGAAVYTLDERGLMAAAEISGARFWVNGDLN